MTLRMYVSVEWQHGDDLLELTDLIRAAVDLEEDGAGIGFGYRDMEFSCTQAEANRAITRLSESRDLGDRAVTVTLIENESGNRIEVNDGD